MVKTYFATQGDLLGWRKRKVAAKNVQPWKPEALDHTHWPPNYLAVYAWRIKTLNQLRDKPSMIRAAKAYYAKRPAEFIMHWMDTYDPRLPGNKWIPFVFFMKQQDLITCLEECSRDGENGLVEKCRDAGATWLGCAYSVHSWLFIKNDTIGWGSRKEDLVDKIGDPTSIFEKIRLIVRRLPDIFKPDGLDERKHMTFMKMINPENGSVIVGETGDNIGRGGRTRIYFKDESAHYERPEKIEAALGDNTNCQIDISSVNGLGNVFHRRREAGVIWHPGAKIDKGYTRVFILDWRDHPGKTQAWYDTRKAKYEREGMAHIFAQEVDRNYSAAVSNTIIPYDWLVHCVDAHKKFVWVMPNGVQRRGLTDEELIGNHIGGLDIADGGIDRNAFAVRQYIVLRHVQEWGERDPGVSTRNVIDQCLKYAGGIEVEYDCIGIGASVKSEYNRLTIDEKKVDANKIKFTPWNAGGKVLDPAFRVIADDEDSPLNKNFYYNLKAQGWWSLRTRVYKTMKNVTEGILYPIDEMLSLDSTIPLIQQLLKELAQPTIVKSSDLRTMVDKQPDGTKSPNLGDATMMAYFPIPVYGQVTIGGYGI